MLKWIEKFWDLLNILVAYSKFFKRKSPCKSAFENKLFAHVCDPARHSVPSGPWNHICPVVLYRTRRAKRPRREQKCMLEMIKAEMSSIIPPFKPIKTSKLLSRSVICKIKYIYVYRI